MTHFYIKNARIIEGHDNDWYVMHPSNDAILASTKEKVDAELIVEMFNKLEKQFQKANFED